MEIHETEKISVSKEQLEKELMQGLSNAEIQDKNPSNVPGVADVIKPKCILPNVGVKLFCDFKNNIKTKVLAKDQDDDTANFIRSKCATTPKEIEIYKRALEETGDRYAPTEWIEFVNKYANSPIVIILEHEIESTLAMRADLKDFLALKKGA